jgi:outer membrane protein OmpA-like peptidoglycan-associated protein
MMNKKYFFLVLMLPLFVFQAQGQSWKLKKANEYFERYDYEKAVSLYESLKEKTPEVYRNLSYAYYVMGDYQKSAGAYSKLIEGGGYEAKDLYRYAYLLRMLGKYDEAKEWMSKFAAMNPNDSRAKRFLENSAYYDELLIPDPAVELKNVSVNGKNADFGPSYYKDGFIVFASSRGFGHLWSGNEQPFLDLYKSKVTEDFDLKDMIKFYGDVNDKYHDGPAAFNANGDYMILTRNIYGQKVEDNKLWLYESEWDGREWSEPVPLHFNSKDYSCGHATLSKDGNRMYFVSDMPGGMGSTDLYYVEKKSNGEWGNPVHLGNVLNTEGKEMFPYFDEEEGYLFYASDGLPGLGGMDIFVAKLQDDGSFSEPVNLGAPVNTNFDDFALIFKTDNGFMSSNREGGKGDDDIYAFTGLKKFKDKFKKYYLAGVVKNEATGTPLPGVKIKIYKDGELYKELIADDSGSFKVEVPKGDYKVEVEKPGYESEPVSIAAKEFVDKTEVTLALPMKRSDVVVDQGDGVDLCSVKINPIYYDLDKYYIRADAEQNLNEIVALMKKYPEMKLEVISHTDSRASHAYNMRLSERRTRSAIKYLVSKGIDGSRLVGKWKGETEPVNECVDGVECSEDKHQLDRRTEFKIIGCKK